MKKRVFALCIALVMLAVMGYAYSASALLDADDETPGDGGNQIIVHETTMHPTTGDAGHTTTELTTATVWTGTDADGNPTPPPATTAPPRFTTRPPRTQPNIPWTPPPNFFHYEGGEVVGTTFVCYECARLDFCVHWLYLQGMIDDIDAFNPDVEEGYPDLELERILQQIRYEDMAATPLTFNWLVIGLMGGLLLLAAAGAVFLLLRGKQNPAMLGDENNFTQAEEDMTYPDATDE